jgi:hypothetical protein
MNNDSSEVYTVKWPAAATHQIKSVSGVLLESNVHRQVALHFYNELRELEDEVQYSLDGNRVSESRGITYVRELSDTILISEGVARQLRDMLNTLFPEGDNA